MHHPTDRIAHTKAFVGALVGTRNSSMGSPHEGSIRRPIAPWANALTTELHLAPSTTVMFISGSEAIFYRNTHKWTQYILAVRTQLFTDRQFISWGGYLHLQDNRFLYCTILICKCDFKNKNLFLIIYQ